MKATKYNIVNAITWYRILTAPVLACLIILDEQYIFKWMLLASFITDAVDGTVARLFRVSSIRGSKIDSLGDDLTVLVAIIGTIAWHFLFLEDYLNEIALLLCLFIIQLLCALIRYRRMTSFHTYLAKLAAVAQGLFFLATFFLHYAVSILFDFALWITALQLVEEIILIALLKNWQTDVRGLYWVLKSGYNDKKFRKCITQ